MAIWLDGANRRIHGTHHQPVHERWEKEKEYLGTLPPADHLSAGKETFNFVHLRYCSRIVVHFIPPFTHDHCLVDN
jgi:hypothetical protein